MPLFLIGGSNEPKKECDLVFENDKEFIVFGDIVRSGIGSQLKFKLRDVLLNHIEGSTVDNLKVFNPDEVFGHGNRHKKRLQETGDDSFERGLELYAKQMRLFKKLLKVEKPERTIL